MRTLYQNKLLRCFTCRKLAMGTSTTFLLIAQSLLSAFLLHNINTKQPQPYIDEIFHIPQAGNYCVYNFSHWDQKITTLPGLYCASILILKSLSIILGCDLLSVCSTSWLRSVNVLFSLGNLYMIWKIMNVLRNQSFEEQSKGSSDVDFAKEGKESEVKEPVSGNREPKMNISKEDVAARIQRKGSQRHAYIGIESLVISQFPVLYFVSHLYYTDAGSVFFVLAMYLCSLNQSHHLAAILGLISFVFRQTNIIWVLFVAGVVVLDFLKQSSDITRCQVKDLPLVALRAVLNNFIQFCALAMPYIFIFVAFGAFLVVNRGIVVGDRSSHVAVFHIPQLFYFLAFTLFFSCAWQLDLEPLWEFIRHFKSPSHRVKHVAIILVSAGIMCVLIYKFTYVHPYLLADNRHYPFYVWKKLYERHWSVRYLLVPIYMYSSWTILYFLRHKSYLWIFLYVACTAVVLIPQKLLEFRYFIIPFIIFRINVKQPSLKLLLCEFFLYVTINAFTFYMFLFRPFYWTHENTLQRFMW